MASASSPPILLEDVTKRYVTTTGPVLAVEGVSLAVRTEEFVTLLGPSGCGKSTVLGMIGGLEDLKGGSVSCTAVGANTWVFARMLAKKMGWEPEKDIKIVGLGGFDAQTAARGAARCRA